jgi:hypothetical protein
MKCNYILIKDYQNIPNNRYRIFADRAEKMALNELPLNNKFREVVKNDFIMRNDSKNYLVFGSLKSRIIIIM